MATSIASILSKRRIFYGWWIVAAGTVAQTLQGGLYFYGFSVFFVPLINEFGWSRAELSGVFSLSRMESGFSGPVEGFLTDRFGPRKLSLCGMILMGTGFVLLSRVQSIVLFYLVFIFMVAWGTSMGTQTSVQTAISNWFIRKRSLAFGVYLTGVGIGGLLVPLLTWLVTNAGWRTTSFMIGIVVWIVGIPLALVLRHRPEQYGEVPDGLQAIEEPKPDKQNKIVDLPEVHFKPVDALKTRAFWLLATAFALRITATNGVTLHLIPYLQDMGFTPDVAGLTLGAVGVMSIIGRAGLGYLGDIFSKRYVLVISHFGIAVGIVLLMSVHGLWSAVLFVIIFSVPYGGAIPLSYSIRGDYFGRKAFGAISGMIGFIQMIGTVGGPLIGGYVYDVTGSYHLAFLLFVTMCCFAGTLMLVARRPSPKLHPEAAYG